MFLILSYNIIKKHFLRVAVKKPTATIQIFYLELGLSRSARSPAFRSSLRSSLTEKQSLKEKTFLLQPNLLFKKVYRGNKEAIQGMANFSNYAINGLGSLFFKGKPADNILLLLAHGRV